MATTMKTVRAILDPDEPDYAKGAQLGADAIPHLRALVNGDDPMLASKATYLASLIKSDEASAIVRDAARSGDDTVRVAAAAAARNLPAAKASEVLEGLVVDADPGVRKVARDAAPKRPTGQLAALLETPDSGGEPDDEGAASQGGQAGMVGQMMPGEQHSGVMPGEGSGLMPGESGMPGDGGARRASEPGEMPR